MRKVYGVGICDSYSIENGKLSKCYNAWQSMLQRCYDIKYQENCLTYIGCTVHPEWHLFSNFKEFYEANYREGFELDKDLLVLGNKVYSKDTCRFVPKCINQIFTDSAAIRGKYPIGVSNMYKRKIKPYQSKIKINGKTKHLGYYVSPEEASSAYTQAKKEYSILVANREYDNGNIPLEIKEAIINRVNMM